MYLAWWGVSKAGRPVAVGLSQKKTHIVKVLVI